MQLDVVPSLLFLFFSLPTHLPPYCLLHSIRNALRLPLIYSARNFKRLKRLVPPESLIKLMEYFHAYVCQLPAPFSICSFFTARCSSLAWHIPFSRVLRVAKAFGNASNSFASFHSAESFDSLFAMEFLKGKQA